MKTRIFTHKFGLTCFLLLLCLSIFGKEKNKESLTLKATSNSFDCVKPMTSYDMKVNNVRARLHVGGNLFSDAAYIYPKPNIGELPNTAIYAAGIWLGGLDRAGNVKACAATYRSIGFDFTAGPLDEITGETNLNSCNNWDLIFSVKGNNIVSHIKMWKLASQSNISMDCNNIPDDVKYWPAHGNPFFKEKYNFELPNQPLAAYYDMNNDGIYNPCHGDYPILNTEDCHLNYHLNTNTRIPAEINYYIINDGGSQHTLTGPNFMNMEIHVQAFAFATDDEVNDMTFYNYKFIGKNSDNITSAYFGFWMDPDLGCYVDDYIGFDLETNMAYIYNQDEYDGFENGGCQGSSSYLYDIPMIGISTMEGPRAARTFRRDGDGQIVKDNNGNIILDETTDPIQIDTFINLPITSFLYMENCGIGIPPENPNLCDPHSNKESHFYNLLQGRGLDGSTLLFNDAYGQLDSIKYAYTGKPNDPNQYSMCSQNILFSDKRMLMSSGPFLIHPGSVNMITYGIIGAMDIKLPCPDISKLQFFNLTAKNMFDQCFEDNFISGPDAPELSAIAKDKELVIGINNLEGSNNFNHKYSSTLENIPDEYKPSAYTFEGYKVYQLRNSTSPLDQLHNPSVAKLIFQTDIKNDISNINNWYLKTNLDTTAGSPVIKWYEELKVEGSNKGLVTNFSLDRDHFASGDEELINGKEYYFVAIAYAYNNYKPFDPQDQSGQQKPYIESEYNIKIFSFSPQHKFIQGQPRAKVTRISGEGNPSVFLEMDSTMYQKVLNPAFDGRVLYQTGFGPIEAKIIDPSKPYQGKYRLEVSGTFNHSREICAYSDDAVWTLTNITTGNILLENKPLSLVKEYAIEELGFSITLFNRDEPGKRVNNSNGGIGARYEYKTPNKGKWFHGVTDKGVLNLNEKYPFLDFIKQENDEDPSNNLSNLGEGFFVPLHSLKRDNFTPNNTNYLFSPAAREFQSVFQNQTLRSLRYRDLNNVDIVFTNDKTKWSKCIVVESASPDYYNNDFPTIGNAKNFELRQSPSIDQNGNQLSDGTFGFSYFPGYAVDVETGQRLNIFFGENSVFSGSNTQYLKDNLAIGGDMLYNPSDQLFASYLSPEDPRHYVLGGQHYIYVTRLAYDECAELAARFRKGGPLLQKIKGLPAVTWTAFPIGLKNRPMLDIAQGLIPYDMTVKLRVDNPYGSSRFYNINRERDCETVGDHPVYEFEFAPFQTKMPKNDTPVGPVIKVTNPFMYSLGDRLVTLFGLPEIAEINILSMDGSKVGTINYNNPSLNHPEQASTIDISHLPTLYKGLHIISITDKATGHTSIVRWMVL